MPRSTCHPVEPYSIPPLSVSQIHKTSLLCHPVSSRHRLTPVTVLNPHVPPLVTVKIYTAFLHCQRGVRVTTSLSTLTYAPYRSRTPLTHWHRSTTVTEIGGGGAGAVGTPPSTGQTQENKSQNSGRWCGETTPTMLPLDRLHTGAARCDRQLMDTQTRRVVMTPLTSPLCPPPWRYSWCTGN